MGHARSYTQSPLPSPPGGEMASHLSPTRYGRGEAWKAYQKQHKVWLPGTTPMISNPVPLERCAVRLMEPPSPPLPPSKCPRPTPKSRTMGVLSTISHSFSRSSLTSSRSKSRNVSGSTLGDPPAPVVQKHSFLSLARLKGRATEPDTSSYEDEQQENTPMNKPPPNPQDPRLVFEAMPSRYWSGRYMSLYDKARSRMLEKDNLDTIIEAQAAKISAGKTDDHTTPGPINPYNNPSTSVYATTRAPPRRSFGDGIRSLRIPHSATTAAIHEATREDSHHTPPTAHPKQAPYTQPPLGLPEQPFAPRPQHHRRPTQQSPSLSNAASRSSDPSAAAALLTDDDRRCRLVLAELDALCATDAALRSFRAWQVEYARKTRRGELLPLGGAMDPARPRETQQKRGLMAGLFTGGSGAGRKSESRSCYSLGGTTTAGVMPPPPEGGRGEEGWRPRLRMSLSTTDAVGACGRGKDGGERRKRRIPGLLGGF